MLANGENRVSRRLTFGRFRIYRLRKHDMGARRFWWPTRNASSVTGGVISHPIIPIPLGPSGHGPPKAHDPAVAHEEPPDESIRRNDESWVPHVCSVQSQGVFVVNPNQSAIRDLCSVQSHRQSIRGFHTTTALFRPQSRFVSICIRGDAARRFTSCRIPNSLMALFGRLISIRPILQQHTP